MHKALILVDIQNDFMPGGVLEVKRANEIIHPINQMMEHFDWVLASKDWHPCNHMSFSTSWNKNVGEVVQVGTHEQKLWPMHCVEDTEGSEHPDNLDSERIHHTFYKGCNRNVDSYSVFLDQNGSPATPIATFLTVHQISDLYFVGVATDYCVKYSVLDALKLGYKATVIKDCCRSVDPEDGEKAIELMEESGAKILESSKLLEVLTI